MLLTGLCALVTACTPPLLKCRLSPLTRPHPQLVAPLIHERDLYLAWSLKRSKAVNGATAVVGVVGKGHLRGVCWALTHDSGTRCRAHACAGTPGLQVNECLSHAHMHWHPWAASE